MSAATPKLIKSKPSKQATGDNPIPLLIQGLSHNAVMAIRLVAEYESETPDALCRNAILSSVESSFGEMRAAALSLPVENQDAKDWADKFYYRVEPLIGLSAKEKAWWVRLIKSANDKALKEAAKTQNSVQTSCQRYWKGREFDSHLFWEETILLTSSRPHGYYEGLYRDTAGRLFIKTELKDQIQLRQVSFNEACSWLGSDGQQRPPAKFLALHGITNEEMPRRKKEAKSAAKPCKTKAKP